MGFQIGGAILDFVVLSILNNRDAYGYQLTQEVRSILDVSETALYPALKRLQKNGLLEMLDPEVILRRVGSAVNPDLLDLRQDRDLGDILGALVTVAAPMIYNGLQSGGDADTREHLENVLQIFERGMGAKRPVPQIEDKETAYHGN